MLDGDVLSEFDAAKAVELGSISLDYGYPVPDAHWHTVLDTLEDDARQRCATDLDIVLDWERTSEPEPVVALPTTDYDRARLMRCYRAAYALMVHECLENEINDLNELDVFAATKPFTHFPEVIEQHRSKLEKQKIMDDLRDQREFTYDDFM